MRRTVEPHTWSGFGVHTGRRTHVRVMPAPAGSGVRLHGERLDIGCVTTDDCATGVPGAMTIEHLLAALRMAGVDDVNIEVAGGEVPCFDGSALPFLNQLVTVGQEGEPNPPLVLEREVMVEEGGRWIIARPAVEASMAVTIDFDGIGPQRCDLKLDMTWSEALAWSVASARTFTTKRLLHELHGRGLGQGVVATGVLVVDVAGHWNKELKHLYEPVMHKWLDLYADLTLLGRPLLARVEAHKPGHRLNHEFVKAIGRTASCKNNGR